MNCIISNSLVNISFYFTSSLLSGGALYSKFSLFKSIKNGLFESNHAGNSGGSINLIK